MKKNSFTALFKRSRGRSQFWVESTILEFTAELERAMKNKSMAKADLARALGTSPAYVTKVLRGDVNFTIESMVKLTRALDSNLHIHVAHEDHSVRWFDLVQETQITHRSAWASKKFANIEPSATRRVRANEASRAAA